MLPLVHNRGSGDGQAVPSIADTPHTHTLAHTAILNLFTCTLEFWKPKLHIFPLASDPCGLTLFLSSIFNILLDGIM